MSEWLGYVVVSGTGKGELPAVSDIYWIKREAREFIAKCKQNALSNAEFENACHYRIVRVYISTERNHAEEIGSLRSDLA